MYRIRVTVIGSRLLSCGYQFAVTGLRLPFSVTVLRLPDFSYTLRLRVTVTYHGYELRLRVAVTCLRLLGNGYWGVGCVFEACLVEGCYW